MPSFRLTGLSALMLSLLLAPAPAAHAQAGGDYDLNWYTIDSGGALLTGGDYALTGTIGQPDAAPPLTGGDYNLQGGLIPGQPPPAGATVSEWALY